MRTSAFPHKNEKTKWEIAIHECGHAVAHLVLDEFLPCPGPYMHEISIYPEEGYLGIVRVDSRVGVWPHKPFTETPVQFRDQLKADGVAEIVERLAGPVAEIHAKYYARALRWYANEAIIQTVLDGKSPNDTDTKKAQDLLLWLWDKDTYGDAWELMARYLFAAALCLVKSEWTGIIRMARLMYDDHVLEGCDFEDEWKKRRLSAEQRNRRDQRLGMGIWRRKFVSLLTPTGSSAIAENLPERLIA